MPHETFHYRSLDQVRETARALDAFTPCRRICPRCLPR